MLECLQKCDLQQWLQFLLQTDNIFCSNASIFADVGMRLILYAYFIQNFQRKLYEGP